MAIIITNAIKIGSRSWMVFMFFLSFRWNWKISKIRSPVQGKLAGLKFGPTKTSVRRLSYVRLTCGVEQSRWFPVGMLSTTPGNANFAPSFVRFPEKVKRSWFKMDPRTERRTIATFLKFCGARFLPALRAPIFNEATCWNLYEKN